MRRKLTFAPNFSAWQKSARRALQAGWRPSDLDWQELGDDQPSLDLLDELEPEEAETSPDIKFRVPREFLSLTRSVSCHRDDQRWPLLYSVLWRLTQGEKNLLQVAVDPDVRALRAMEKEVRRDVHKMRAFVRFRAVRRDNAVWYVAWFEPAHHIVELNTPFFVDRFASMNWSILTPERCVHWDGKEVTYTEGMRRSDAPGEDAVEALWLKYYASIFNPARVKTRAMEAEMPKKYWKNLPESVVIPTLIQEAPLRVADMITKSQSKAPSARVFAPAPVPPARSLATLREAASQCKACPLYADATQTVFGEGERAAPLVLVGEQPGDSEDREGRPFVGPAGSLLNKALLEAGITREDTYVTNAVKHFKWEPRGKRRLHKKPSEREVAACRPWLEAELGIIKPTVLVCLGATAAQSIVGSEVRVLRDRGQFMESDYCAKTIVTVHPSSLLRTVDEEARERDYRQFVEDLRLAASGLA